MPDPLQQPPHTPVSQPIIHAGVPQNTPGGKKMLLFIVGGIVALLVIVGGVGWWMGGEQTKQYVQAADRYDETVKTAFTYYRDSKSPSKDVAGILKHFDDALATKPQTPKLWGLVPLTVPIDSTQQVDKLADQLTALRNSFKNLHDLNDYGTAIIKIMNDNAGVIDRNTIAAAEPRFKKVVTDLKALTPPDKAKAFHQAKVDAYSAMADDIHDALTALGKNDGTSYSAAITQLSTDSKSANTSGAAKELNTFYNEYYEELNKAYDTLATTLGL